MKKRIFAALLAVGMALAGCSSTTTQGQKYVAVIAKSVNSDFFRNMKNGVESAATEYNVRVTFEGPENEEDYLSQNALIANAVKNGADAILLSSIDYHKTNDAVSEAVKNGVKVITVDSGISSELVSQFIGTDNRAAGKTAGLAAVSGFASEAQIFIGIVNCTEETDNGKQREEGFREAIAAVPNAEITAIAVTDSNTESAKEGALKLLREYSQINVLVGFNEWLTLGIGEAIRESDAAQRVRGIGFDTNVLSVSMLETGEMDALVVQNPFAIGYLGVMNAARLIGGETLDSPEIYTEVLVVNKENMFDEDVQKLLFRFQ